MLVEICYWDIMEAPIGSIYLAAIAEGLVYTGTSRDGGKEMHLWLAKYLLGHIPDCALKQGSNPILNTAKQQLMAYFTGESKVLDVPLKLIGTTFRKSVWQALRTIPYGETRTYGQIAAQVGRPKGPRAVGQANHHNPLAIFVP
jgi:O6-methylguanine-DNA--protein-cysteine methyltransferase